MKRVLTIGLGEFELAGSDCVLENGGLGRHGIVPKSASALYDHDVIIINTESYSHFIFGSRRDVSGKDNELSLLKRENSRYDFASIVNWPDRENELRVAIQYGATVVWCLSPPARQNFFGFKTTYSGYLSGRLGRAVERAGVIEKHGRSIGSDKGFFPRYFASLRQHGWRIALEYGFEGHQSVGTTPEGYSLAGSVDVGMAGWLVTPPSNSETASALVLDALSLPNSKPAGCRYHGIFICHSSVDKPFVWKLRARLIERGINSVWVDEAEIKIGDSLTGKIEQAIVNNAYVGVVVSPDSVKSSWVQRELAMGFAREDNEKKVVVVPLLYKDCEVPLILRDKAYADFRSEDGFEAGVEKILRRLED